MARYCPLGFAPGIHTHTHCLRQRQMQLRASTLRLNTEPLLNTDPSRAIGLERREGPEVLVISDEHRRDEISGREECRASSPTILPT